MIKIFIITFIGMAIFGLALGISTLRGRPISSCHGGEKDKDCGHCTNANEEIALKEKIRKKARALLASYYPRS